MTNHTPAPKASSAATLLASFTVNIPRLPAPPGEDSPPKTADEDFSSLILNALTVNRRDQQASQRYAAPSARETSQTAANVTNPDPTGLLLPMLLQTAPPQPHFPIEVKFAPQTTATSSKTDAKNFPGATWQKYTASGDSRSDPGRVSMPKTEPAVALSQDDQEPGVKLMTQTASTKIQPLPVSSDLRASNGLSGKSAMLSEPSPDENEPSASELSAQTVSLSALETAEPIADGKIFLSDLMPLTALSTPPKVALHKRTSTSVTAIPDSRRARGPDSQQTEVSEAPKASTQPKGGKDQSQGDPAPQRPVPDGTSVAISGQRMNFAAQKNEFAGSAEQNLPLAQSASVPVVDTATDAAHKGAATSLDFFWRETPSEMISMVNLSAKPAEASAAAPVSISAPMTTPAARLEQMISQEAVTIRQSGAQSLGVSLKLDDNTHLFLQLTTQNGTIQASLRCEKGDFSALDSQWTQLQTSLARQNIELLPVSAGAQSNFQQTSQQQQQQRQFLQQQEDRQQANLGVSPTPSRQQKNPNAPRSRPDREFWA
jgi:hypothetical protein